MNTRLGFVKLTALAAVCAVGFGMTPFAHADGISIGYHSGWHGHSRYSVSVGLGSGYYGGGYYYAPRYYAPRYYAPAPVYYYPSDSYYDDDDYPNYGYYNSYPAYRVTYSNYGRGYYDRDNYRQRRWNRDDRRGWGGDRDHRYGDRDGDSDHHRHW